jgi:transcription elongation factor GreB
VSKAFTKDDAWEEPLIPPRAPLPDGAPNLVTPRGMRLLRAELAELEAERQGLDGRSSDEGETRRRLAIVAGRLRDLSARIASAEVVDASQQAHDIVRFGASVVLRSESGDHEGEERRLQIVGVDEADAANGRIAFTAPIARAIMGLQVGETASLTTPRGEESLLIVSID